MLNQNAGRSLCATIILASAIGSAAAAVAAENAPAQPTALTNRVEPLSQIMLIETPLSPPEEIAEIDAVRAMQGLPPRFAEPNPVVVTPSTHGNWEKLHDGTMLWRLRIGSRGAKSLNLGFSRYVMPQGGTLFLYAADRSEIIRAFTAADNKDHQQLWTPVIHHNEIVLEVTLPDESFVPRLALELTAINVGYRSFLEDEGDAFGARSGSCNVDVVCPEGDPWRDQIQSVAVYTLNGIWTCTGAAINNTAFDRTPYFLTADHCGIDSSDDATIVVYWNFQNSTCRPPGGGASGGAGDGQLNQFQTGSTLRAEYGASDMTLIELDNAPNPAWEVFYAGWNRATEDYASVVAIHHPNTDEKRISFEDDATTTTTYLQNTEPGDGTHIRVIDWDLGTTEPGSSGSPLFDPNQRIVGQLHGGYASCTSQTSDWYGRVSTSWTGGGSAASRLSDWLDPLGTGAMTIDGTGLDEPPVTENVSVQMIIDTTKAVTLAGSDGNMDPLDFILLSLPANGSLSDPQAGAIASVPYTLANNGQVVNYIPTTGYTGSNSFSFKANDGNVPPDGGDSNTSSVFITIVNVPPLITTTNLPDGAVGEPYGPVQIAMTGGEGAVTWQIVADVPYIEEDLGVSGFAATGVALGLHGDDVRTTVSLPFAFPFYDNLETQVRIWTNGFLNFGAETGSSYANTTALLQSNARIAPLWDDLMTTAPSDVYTDASVSGEFTVRWDATTRSGGHPVACAVTLHETGEIDFHYGPGNTPITATIGVSSGDGSRYTVASYDGNADLGSVNSIRLKKPDQLSPGLSMTPDGVLSGTPQVPGAFLPVIRVTDSLSRSDEAAIPLTVLALFGDFDLDGDVDVDDLIRFTECLAGPMSAPPAVAPPPTEGECLTAFDSDANARIDLVDFAALQEAMSP